MPNDTLAVERVSWIDTQYGYQFDFQFEYYRPGRFHLIYCLKCPPSPYVRDVRVDHLYSTGRVCVTKGREPKTRDMAKAIAQVWLRGWSLYINTGVFPNGAEKVYVPDA